MRPPSRGYVSALLVVGHNTHTNAHVSLAPPQLVKERRTQRRRAAPTAQVGFAFSLALERDALWMYVRAAGAEL